MTCQARRAQFVAQAAEPAVSPAASRLVARIVDQRSFKSGRACRGVRSQVGNLRYSRLGSLRYCVACAPIKILARCARLLPEKFPHSSI
jgi:hypothetical protein